MKTIVVAGAASGVGKTTVAVGLMAALSRRGAKVQPYKAGPDYIDPSHHTVATGNPSRNLDTWLLSAPAVVELFLRSRKGKDIGVVEGVMGLFDGRSATGEDGSTAELAKLLRAPVLLVLDASGACRSLGAMVRGYGSFDPGLRLAGVILNNIGSEQHFAMCKEAIVPATGVPVLGYLPKNGGLSLPERHLGLVPAAERAPERDFLERLAAQCEATMDLSGILGLCEQAAPNMDAAHSLFPAEPLPKVARIAVARDRAFSFYYEDSLDLLDAWGADVFPFSPLADSALPRGSDGLYLGGGFPELYASELEGNAAMLKSVKAACRQGMPVHAECGGLMYLGESIRDFGGKVSRMAGVFPVCSRIDRPSLSLGYRTVRALSDTPLLAAGEAVRGHEFHWSVLESAPEGNAYEVDEQGGRREGFLAGNTLASYVHLHVASRPDMARHFVEKCRRHRASG